MIRFSVSALEKAPVTLKGHEEPEFLALAPDDTPVPVSPVTYCLTAEKVSGGILVTGNCQVEIAGICGRCLAPVRRVVEKNDLHLFFETALEEEMLDVSEDVRAELLLEFPMNLLCNEACLGLCPECGENLNEKKCSCHQKKQGDARWNALDSLQL